MRPLLDPADEPLWSSKKWCPHGRSSEYFKAKVDGQMVYLHRIVAGAGPGQIVDHINGNPLDCRRSNLRLCDRVGSNSNRGRRRDSNAPYKGITRTKSGRWLAQIMCRKIYERIGLFDTPEAAAAAYDVRATQLHGEYARTNGFGG